MLTEATMCFIAERSKSMWPEVYRRNEEFEELSKLIKDNGLADISGLLWTKVNLV